MASPPARRWDGGGLRLTLSSLICRVGARGCALPIENVREVMRPCAIQPVAAAPPWVLGLAAIRGEAVPVVDTAALLGAGPCAATRFVVLRAGKRRVALAVAGVLGIRPLEPEAMMGLPPLLAASSDRVASLALLDGELHDVLQTARLVDLASESLSGASSS